tara:strand:- start:502 stop:1314 length:813 start_codon:yes stop_codon:yes gene_type:complete
MLCVLMLGLSFALCARAESVTSVSHVPWDQLLHAHVVDTPDGRSTSVDYAGMLAERAKLSAYLQSLALVKKDTFASLSQPAQLAFLINAYNAWTVELVLTAYPDLTSIKDLGSFFRSPWSRAFIPLLEETRSLDNIEHDLIRGDDGYQEPRIHFAVNCASIGCPALRAEAYTEARLESQLEDQTRRFLQDSSRNRVVGDGLEVSSIFKWYREDFQQGWLGYSRLEDFFSHYSDLLGLNSDQVQALSDGSLKIRFVAYDWALNQSVKPRTN